MARLKAKEIAILWEVICGIYDSTREWNSPERTMRKMIAKIGLDGVWETFSAITKLKKNDGRIYGKNREMMERFETAKVLEEHSHENPLIDTGLCDHIHTAHINNLITELIKIWEE